jgi:hypothetical protein
MEPTKIAAIKKCREMWQYIADNGCVKGTAVEKLWPGKTLLHNCWACEYTRVEGTELVDCTVCPLWPAAKCNGGFGCEMEDSPYQRWLVSGYDAQGSRACALEIVAMCDAGLGELSI